MCRRATGGPFAVIVWVPSSAVRWEAALPQSRSSSRIARRSFCNECGTPIHLEYYGSDELGFMVGSFDDPNAFAPQYHYGIEGRLKWADAGALLPPGRETEEVL
jgi:hypothetical protein